MACALTARLHVIQARCAASGVVIVALLSAPVEGACRNGTVQPGSIPLENCLPIPVTPAEVVRLRATLPPAGEVTDLQDHDRQKLEAVRAVLHAVGRGGVYDLKIVEAPQARAGLYGRAILLISLPALRLLDKEELAAIAAHEAGHEYVWKAFEEATIRSDHARLRQLEGVCDAFAVMALSRVGIARERLASALQRLFAYNRSRFGVAMNERSYPPLQQRLRMLLDAPDSGPGGAVAMCQQGEPQ